MREKDKEKEMSWLMNDDNEYILDITKMGSKGEVIKHVQVDISGNLSSEKRSAWKAFNKQTKFTRMTECTVHELIPASSTIKGRYKYKVTDGTRHIIVDSLASGRMADTTIMMAKMMLNEPATRNDE